ncbi:MAG: hypothetical protein H0U49_01250 [Parachlamydiaceae bacterium]|nr:hypothetical protein [Parachlamydiaceae bacterium]
MRVQVAEGFLRWKNYSSSSNAIFSGASAVCMAAVLSTHLKLFEINSTVTKVVTAATLTMGLFTHYIILQSSRRPITTNNDKSYAIKKEDIASIRDFHLDKKKQHLRFEGKSMGSLYLNNQIPPKRRYSREENNILEFPSIDTIAVILAKEYLKNLRADAKMQIEIEAFNFKRLMHIKVKNLNKSFISKFKLLEGKIENGMVENCFNAFVLCLIYPDISLGHDITYEEEIIRYSRVHKINNRKKRYLLSVFRTLNNRLIDLADLSVSLVNSKAMALIDLLKQLKSVEELQKLTKFQFENPAISICWDDIKCVKGIYNNKTSRRIFSHFM